MANIDWNTTNTTDLLILPTHTVQLTALGPSRASPSSNVPAIILLHGMGGSGKSEWAPILSRLPHKARVYFYNRSGYSPSTRASRPPTLRALATEVHKVVTAAQIPPPYLLVGHSYGGLILQRYVLDYGLDTVAGAVIVDTASSKQELPADWMKLLEGTTYEDVVLKGKTVLTEEEFKVFVEESGRNECEGGIGEEEWSLCTESAAEVKRQVEGKELFGDRPLSVLFCQMHRDFQKVYDYAVEHGSGTQELREEMKGALSTLEGKERKKQQAYLAFSSRSRWVEAEGKAATHNIQLTAPGFLVGEIERTYRECLGSTS